LETKRLKKTPNVKGSSEFTKKFLKDSRKNQQVVDSIREDIGNVRDEIAYLNALFSILSGKISETIDIMEDFDKTVNGIDSAIDNIEQRVDELEK
jgi:predicted transcriptional regulator